MRRDTTVAIIGTVIFLGWLAYISFRNFNKKPEDIIYTNCDSFATRQEAQEYFLRNNAVHLDHDKDGEACEDSKLNPQPTTAVKVIPKPTPVISIQPTPKSIQNPTNLPQKATPTPFSSIPEHGTSTPTPTPAQNKPTPKPEQKNDEPVKASQSPTPTPLSPIIFLCNIGICL
jgi:hypothetical protein